MKSLALGIVISILFSSLPAKVWACGLNLCPMDHHETNQQEQMMPCHQKASKTQNVKKDNHSDLISLPAACPCPDTYLDATYVIDNRSLLEISKIKIPNTNNILKANLKTQNRLNSRYRPPPPMGVVRLQIIHQVFLI